MFIKAEPWTALAEAEAWTAIADTIVMTGELPSGFGLCATVNGMQYDGLLNRRVSDAMKHRITVALRGKPYLARMGAVKPRIEWARKFARAALREARAK